MKQVFDTDTTLFQTLSNYPALTSELSGGVYLRQRPDNSEAEDIVINTITLTQEFAPQLGTSNVNIYVKDITVTHDGKPSKMPNVTRLRTLSGIVMEALRGAYVAGLAMRIESQSVIDEPAISQHFVNIRIRWNIH